MPELQHLPLGTSLGKTWFYNLFLSTRCGKSPVRPIRYLLRIEVIPRLQRAPSWVTLSRMTSKNPSKPAKSAAKPSYLKAAASAKQPEKINPSLIKRGKK